MTHKMIKLTCMALLPTLLLILLPARSTLAVDLDNIATFEDLQDAIADYATADMDMTITVTENIIITDTLTIPNTGHTLTITSDGGPHKLTRNITGNLFSVVTNANLKLQNITIDGNNTSITNAYGPLVHVGGGSFTMENNATLQNNTTFFGGGVIVSGGSFTMNGGTISNNTAYNGGGGVYIFIGSFTMNGGTIKNNSTTSYGGGVFVDGATFTMSGGAKISSNTAQTGGGVYVFGGGTFTMKGTAEISGNKANFGGGGGVYVFGGSLAMLGGTAKITGNTLTGDTTPNNLELFSGWPIMLGTSEDAPASGMEIGVTVSAPSEGQTIVQTGAEEESAEYFSYDSSGWYVVHQSGALVLTTTNPNFTITFDSNGGNSVASQNIISGETAIIPTNPTRTGYTFAGWYSDAGLITVYDFSAPVTADITLHAKWQQQTDPPTPIVTHSVSFNTNGGSSVTGQTVEDGQTAIKPTNPTRTGYTFAGWYSNIGLTTAYNFDTPVTADITLHAKWSSNSTGNDKDKDKDSGSTPPTTPTQPTPPGPDLGGGKLTTPPDQPPVTDKNGNTNLPGGGQITTPGGTMLDLPPNTTINKSGQITVGRGGATANRNGLTLRIPENMEIIMDIDVPLGFYITVFNPFVDVRQNDWFFSQVIFAYNHGLMIGTSTEPMLFSPNAPLTRAMLVNILYRLAGEPATTGLPIPYTDVEEGKWYTNAIKWAAANNIAQGIGGGTFAPDAGIPREQIAVVIDNFLAHMGYTLPQINPAQAYGDAASISNLAADSITLMQQTGLMTGQPDNTFNPQGLTTRAEAATMLKRLIEAIVK